VSGAANLEGKMKKLAIAAAFSLAATSAFAGSMAAPMMEPEVIVQDTSSSAGGILVPILFLIAIAAIASS